mmetsp:Transcript_18656/g.24625  ORF Transcript_18656/g.24625 Transcript_18656/m.24625 type:complete len:219 (-) Transcript_18656:202-858(-)
MPTKQLLDLIDNYPDPDNKLEEARKIIYRIYRRQLYKCVGYVTIPPESLLREEDILHELEKDLDSLNRSGERRLIQGIAHSADDDDDMDVLTQTEDYESDAYDQHDVETQSLMQSTVNDPSNQLQKDELRVTIQSFHCGQKNQNPMKKVRFFKKNAYFGRDKAHEMDPRKYQYELPSYFQIKQVRLYCTSRKALKQRQALQLLKQWCRKNEVATPVLT